MVTMQEIGDSLGVSKAAVSLVLNGKDQGRIRRETAQAIRQTAQVMGYSPKKTSYSSEKKTRILGFISDHIATSPYAGRLIFGAQEAARQLGYIIVAVNTDGDDQLQASEISALKSYGVDGFLYACVYNQVIHLPQSLNGERVVIVDATDTSGHVPSIIPDERHIGRTATRHLIDVGCKRIAFIGSFGPMQAQRGRLAGYCKELTEHGMAVDDNLIVNVEMGQDGMEKVARLVDRYQPDGFFCFNDARAWYVYSAAMRRGLNVGQDISVVGVDNHQVVAEMMAPSLTTIELPHYEMGYWATLKLISLIERRRLDDLKLLPTNAPIPSLDRIHAQVKCVLIEKESVVGHS